MFDNILHQSRVIESLSGDLKSASFAPAVLFHGPENAGKMSTALELARVMSCLKSGAPWGCDCSTCRQHRYIMSPYTLFLGRRAFGREIRAAGLALQTEDKEGTRFLFLRAVRKLLRRFDPVLWDQDPKLSQAAKIVEKLEEHMDLIAPGKSAPEPAKLESLLTDIYKVCESLSALLPQDGINIAMVRRVSYWARTADAAHPKIVLIEGAESMNESCRNSLLKILEEPPPSVYFVLLTAHKSAILQTVLSRLRPYAFAERSAGAQADVIERVFRQPKGRWKDFADFFMGREGGASGGLQQRAQNFAHALLWKAGLSCLIAQQTPQTPIPGNGTVPRELSLSNLNEGFGRDDLEDLVRLGSRSLLDSIKELGSKREILEKAGLDELRATDSIQGLVRKISRAYSEALIYNLSGSEVIERVYSEAEDGPCVVSFKGQ